MILIYTTETVVSIYQHDDFQIPIILLWGYGMVLSNNLVKIEKTKPQIIFEPLGKFVTQFTNANIKIHLDLKPLQEEVLEACHTALLLNHNLKNYKIQSGIFKKVN